MSQPIVINHKHNQSNLHFFPNFSTLFVFLQLDLLGAASTSKVVVVHASCPSRRRLAGEEARHHSSTAPMTVVGLDKTRLTDS
jgi:hypothetical protein